MMNRDLKAFWAVVLISAAVYGIFAGGHYGGDAINNYLTTESIVLDGDLEIYDREFSVEELGVSGSRGVAGKSGARYSPYGLGMALLQLPLYLLGLGVAGVLRGVPGDYITFFFSSFTSAVLSAFNAGFVLLLARRLGAGMKESAAAALVYAFSTMAFVYSQTGFPEPAMTACLLAAVILIMRYREGEGAAGGLALAGLALGFMAMIKIYAVILVPVFLLYFLSGNGYRKRTVWAAAFGFLLLLALDLSANYLKYGSVLMTGYGHIAGKIKYGDRFIKGLYYYWFSSGKGFFFYNLPAVLGCLGLVRLLKTRKPDAMLLTGITAVYVVFFAYFFRRGSLFSWGPRYVFPLLPVFMASSAVVLGKRPYRMVFLVLAFAGCLVQAPAVLSHYPGYINFVKSLGINEYMINFIPDLSPIGGTWRIFLSSIGTGPSMFVYDPDPLFVESVSGSFSGFDKLDIWPVNMVKAFPGMLLPAVAGVAALGAVLVSGIYKLRKALK
ncbi:MAG: hypothetical protein GF408_02870 [Candidatus Omnitrophica bacterium]|nr:hypothetical protein [Candidatus Omnitrophota bacterium]